MQIISKKILLELCIVWNAWQFPICSNPGFDRCVHRVGAAVDADAYADGAADCLDETDDHDDADVAILLFRQEALWVTVVLLFIFCSLPLWRVY